jgi:cubilin
MNSCGNCPFGYAGDGKTCLPTTSQPSNLECADSSICHRNALCVQYPNLPPKCLCKYGFTGNGFGEFGCEPVPIDPCSITFCRNGGTCVRNGTVAYCECPPGTDLPFCNRYMNPCARNPCMNGGNCSASFRSFRCTCPSGFSGNRCQNQASTCGGVKTDFNGTIRYPENPTAEAYRHNSRCAWLIKTNATKVLNITFNSFNVEFSQDCRFDWLQVRFVNFLIYIMYRR